MSKAIITGGCGFLGTYLAGHLLEKGYIKRVVLVDNFHSEHTKELCLERVYRNVPKDRVTIEIADVGDTLKMMDIIQRHGHPKIFFHFAGVSRAVNSCYADAVQSTSLMTAHLLECFSIMRYRPTRFIFSSSTNVYGNYQKADEDTPRNPVDVYGAIKSFGEDLTRAMCSKMGIPYTIIRPCTIYGGKDFNEHRFLNMCKVAACLTKSTILPEITVNSGVKTDYIHIKDAVTAVAICSFHKSGENQVFNIGTGRSTSLVQIVNEIKKHKVIRYRVKHIDSWRPNKGILDIKKIKKLGFAPKIDIKDGIDCFINDRNWIIK